MIDSHAHLTSKELLASVEDIATRAKQAGVTKILNICTDPDSLREGILLSGRHPWIQNAGATTPHDVARDGEEAFPVFARAAQEKKLVAIGETGLDYHYEHSPKDVQKEFLRRYLALAAEHRLPVIFHCRDAFADLFSIVDEEYPRKAPAVLHCFTGTEKEAEEVLQRGWYISFSGIVTFKKSEALRAVVKCVPLSQMLIETDSPYLAPQSKRGQRNEPAFLSEIARCIADIKGISVDEVTSVTAANTERLFFFCPG